MRLIVPLLLAVNLWGAGAQRIVSTAPRITESLFAMGLGPRVVDGFSKATTPDQSGAKNDALAPSPAY
jgi:hypothetical protein